MFGRIIAICILFCGFIAWPALAQSSISAMTIIRYGQIASSAKSISSLPLYVAQRKGFFAKEGIELEVRPIEGGTHFMIEALDKGDVDVSYTATPYLIQAVLKGSNAVGVAGGPRNTISTLVGRPGIKSIDDLRGKTIGLSLAVDTISIATRRLLAKKGLPEADYRVIELVSGARRQKCLVEGECDAVPLTQPEDLKMIDQGYERLGDSLEVFPDLQFSVLAVDRTWASTHKDVLIGLVKANGAAYRFIRDPQNRDEVASLITETTGAPISVASRMLSMYFEPERSVYPRQGEISLNGFNQVIALMGESNELKKPLPSAERFVDLQYLMSAGLQ